MFCFSHLPTWESSRTNPRSLILTSAICYKHLEEFAIQTKLLFPQHDNAHLSVSERKYHMQNLQYLLLTLLEGGWHKCRGYWLTGQKLSRSRQNFFSDNTLKDNPMFRCWFCSFILLACLFLKCIYLSINCARFYKDSELLILQISIYNR